jgi:MoxR-like ATPase
MFRVSILSTFVTDEINRASPRTQSVQREAMAESQVSIDGQLRQLEDLFFVIAIQNPVESRGTYPLPEAQMDRFALQFSLGYIPPEEVTVTTDQIRNKEKPRLNKIVSGPGLEGESAQEILKSIQIFFQK